VAVVEEDTTLELHKLRPVVAVEVEERELMEI
jgi:hypothetical protein